MLLYKYNYAGMFISHCYKFSNISDNYQYYNIGNQYYNEIHFFITSVKTCMNEYNLTAHHPLNVLCIVKAYSYCNEYLLNISVFKISPCEA